MARKAKEPPPFMERTKARRDMCDWLLFAFRSGFGAAWTLHEVIEDVRRKEAVDAKEISLSRDAE